MGTPEFAKTALEAIHNAGHNVIGVFSQPPKPVGRKQILQNSPVHEYAEQNGIPVYTPKSLRKGNAAEIIKELNPDVIVVAAYGFIIPESILDTPKYGCINIHASILPRWRGAAPIQHAIMAGDDKTGITVMKMDPGMDTGDIISIGEVAIDNNTTYGSLVHDLSVLGSKMIVETLADLENSLSDAYVQPADGATIAGKITKEMEQIDWNKTAQEIERNIRAFNPAPSMWSTVCGTRMKFLKAEIVDDMDLGIYEPGTVVNEDFIVACGMNTYLKILEVQPAGKSIMSAQAFINGHKNIIGGIYETLN